MTMSKRIKIGLFVLIVAAAFALFAVPESWAIPASPFPFKATLRDGTTVEVYRRGDEFRNWVETSEGYTVLKNEITGFWEYAVSEGVKLVSAGVEYSPGKNPPDGLGKYQKSESSAAGAKSARNVWTPRPVAGTRKVLLIRVEFEDREFSMSEELHRDQIFGASDSVKRYYLDQSLGKLNIVPAIDGLEVMTVKFGEHPYPDGWPSKDEDFEKDEAHLYEVAFVKKVLEAAMEAGMDFSKFDDDGDKRLTLDEVCVYMIIAGYEESSTDKKPAIWAHAEGSAEAGYLNFCEDESHEHAVRAGGMMLANWAMHGELNDNNAPTQIGSMAHELGHLLCYLPDLYDVSGGNVGLGSFSLMDYGCFGEKEGGIPGSSPVNLDAWSRWYLGWEEPTRPESGSVTFTTPGRGNGKSSVKLLRGGHRTTEYFLAEVRDFSGWDRGLEWLFLNELSWRGETLPENFNGGLLIMHVDEAVGHGRLEIENDDSNDINNAKKNPHQGVMAVDASDPRERGKHSVPYTLWWGDNPAIGEEARNQDDETGVTVNFKKPASNFYNGVVTNISITGISGVEDGTMTATVTAPRNSSGGCNAAAGAGLAAIALFACEVYLENLTKRRKV